MGRGHLQNSDLNRGHEPVGIPLNRPPVTFSPTVGEGRDEGVRFMESLLSLLRTHWDHEPLRLTEARSGPRVCDPQAARFMERIPLKPVVPVMRIAENTTGLMSGLRQLIGAEARRVFQNPSRLKEALRPRRWRQLIG